MSPLANQTILLISPQPWNHLHISKHHYAIELARRGNTVYYLDPPNAALSSSVQIEPVAEQPGAWVVRYRPWFPFVLRFHVRWLFDRLMRRQIRGIRAAISRPIDAVWSFEFNLFTNLRDFGAPLVVFHPVDPLSYPYQVDVARSADAVFSVSDEILASFRDIRVPSSFINHGLSESFAELARVSLGTASGTDGKRRVGYAGNLIHPAVNTAVLQRMIAENPSVEFHFWGPFTSVEEPAAPAAIEFVDFLHRSSNVQLHGAVSPRELAGQLQHMDCLVLSYAIGRCAYDRSNSHKILEYLSTGKVVVSSRLSTYVTHSDLLRMPADGDDDHLPAMLRDTLARLEEFNAVSRQDERRLFALDNTYARQLDRIEAKLSQLAPREVVAPPADSANRRESRTSELQPEPHAG